MDSSTIDTIREYAADIDKTKQDIKTLNEAASEQVESETAYNEVAELTEQLAAAKERLKSSLMSNHVYNDVMEKLAECKNKLADQEDILSLHIVEYYAGTHERQIEMNAEGDAREILVKGKLGKRGKFQTRLV